MCSVYGPATLSRKAFLAGTLGGSRPLAVFERAFDQLSEGADRLRSAQVVAVDHEGRGAVDPVLRRGVGVNVDLGEVGMAIERGREARHVEPELVCQEVERGPLEAARRVLRVEQQDVVFS